MKKFLKYEVLTPYYSAINKTKEQALAEAHGWFRMKYLDSKALKQGELSLKIESYDDTFFRFVVFNADGQELTSTMVQPMVDQEPVTWMSKFCWDE